ncbi:ATP-dependent nuclease [Pseudomonas glycinae]|uniref:ATP-dependent nuclease n=1 Tax=Pseudomonas glycinae TaxID=1785145 RepID=UPI002B1D7C57|nr:AAA family ATPase [Pseudomonas glycinae]
MKLQSISYRGIRALNASVIPYKAEIPEGTLNFVVPFARFRTGDVNVFIGENGSGKSSIIDMIRASAVPGILATLVRENPIGYCPPAYCLTFNNGHRAIYKFRFAPFDRSLPVDFAGCETYFDRGSSFGRTAQDLHKYDPAKHRKLPPPFLSEDQLHYRHCGQVTPVIDKHCVEELNRVRGDLAGLADRSKDFDDPGLRYVDENSLIDCGDGTVKVCLGDDIDVFNRILVQWFPSGWQSYAATAAWLVTRPKDSICLIEEPEVHLHPKLQRLLLRRLLAIAEQNVLQLFISTHSAALINSLGANAHRKVSVKLFQTTNGFVEPALDLAPTLEALGYKASDILQSNCVIWVEGPSDRIYLNYWIKGHNTDLVEGVHYTIMFYGGRLFRHVSGAEASEEAPEDGEAVDDFISLRRINRHSAIVFDSDKASANSPLSETKRRLQKEFGSQAWVTQGREIENYLDEGLLFSSIKAAHKHATNMLQTGQWANLLKYEIAPEPNQASQKPRTATKVKVARDYVKTNPKVDFSPLDLRERITHLCDFIVRSNHYEV